MKSTTVIVLLFLAVIASACQPAVSPTAPPQAPSPTTAPASSNRGSSDSVGLDGSQTPNYGTSSLSSGFTPDPLIVALQSGGDIDAATLELSPQNESGICRGSVTSSPDYRIDWSGSTTNLRIFYAAADNGDTTLIVQTPDGNWLCDDDTGGNLQPQIDIANPEAGAYAIWVGSFQTEEALDGNLYITELDYSPSNLP
jgi:hypothetical protein